MKLTYVATYKFIHKNIIIINKAISLFIFLLVFFPLGYGIIIWHAKSWIRKIVKSNNNIPLD